MKVRPATPQDAEAACIVLRASITELCVLDHNNEPNVLAGWLKNKTPEIVRGWMTQAHFTVLVAEDNGEILGVGGMFDTGMIVLNYVAPRARFHGVSRALIDELEVRARALGLAACRLESTRTALRFYASRGFVRDESVESRTTSGIPAVPMSKQLTYSGEPAG